MFSDSITLASVSGVSATFSLICSSKDFTVSARVSPVVFFSAVAVIVVSDYGCSERLNTPLISSVIEKFSVPTCCSGLASAFLNLRFCQFKEITKATAAN